MDIKPTTFCLLACSFVIACSTDYCSEKFQLPKVINTQYAITTKKQVLEPESLSEVFPSFIGKYKFGEVVDLNMEKQDTSTWQDYISEYSINQNDSLDVNGFELIVDYNNEVYFNRFFEYDSVLFAHYPVYFVNSTNSNKIFIGKDSHAFGIQEAKALEGFSAWRPIESSSFDSCGNGGWGLIIKPGEFAVMLMRKYGGETETDLRVRAQMGNSTFVSKPFKGVVNQKQFNIDEGSYAFRILRDRNSKALYWLFYGATPKTKEGWIKY